MTNNASATKTADYGVIATMAILALLVLIAVAFQAGTSTVAGTPYPAPAVSQVPAPPHHGMATVAFSVPTTIRPDVVAEHLANGDCGAFPAIKAPAWLMERGCTAVSVDDVGEDVWNALEALGYMGQDDDGTDSLRYAPVDVIGALQDLEAATTEH